MKLSNLDKYVPGKLYKRGVDYFEQDYVKDLREDGLNRWHAVVSGTGDYHVSVILNDGDTILSSFCTCPFESDSLCKHEVAVCLAIQEHKNEYGSAPLDVLSRLKELKKAELLDLLEDLLQKQPAVNLYLVEKFSETAEMDEAKVRRMIRKSASRAGRSGFIAWDMTGLAIEGALEVQGYLDTLDPEQDGEKIIRFSLIIIYECSKMLEKADDSSGIIGTVIGESLRKIGEVMEQWPEKLDQAIIDRILDLFYPAILFHLEQDMTDLPVSLVGSLMEWSDRGDYGNKIYDFIEKIIGSEALQNKIYQYEIEQFRLFQLMILRQQGDQVAVEAFYQTHRAYPYIRKAEVERAMEAGEFEQAVRLCKESELVDSDLAGLVLDWKKKRFEAYSKLGWTKHQTALAYELAAAGEKDYYHELKKLVEADEWQKTVASLLKDLKKTRWNSDLYRFVLVEEKMTEELLEYCRSHLHTIETLYPHLLKEYPHEVNELFTSYIYQMIAPASDRKKYQEACRKIKIYKKALGKEAAAVLIDELKFMYPKRKALLDELSKISY
ncbi:SWIM zinc finger family protein [Planococcus glaciei]|uniref:SWIM-type domain-containing protein n=1 Tax=Planococcus glaciei TaxID=459472 RepID=A0A7H8QCM8_9BACL|nr:hypothetical protein [Planococcus glaciei]MBX0315230.1 hypothetical protein [Planococcus glaciei]QKX51115.1 hypothetical protein HF394_11230 [Planococcus glaciei]